MEVFCCTVHVKQQLTMDACRYYMRHNHACSWLSPIYAAITLFVTMTVILHIFWARGLPVHSPESKILIVIAYSVALFTSIFWLFFMPRSLRIAMFFRLRTSGTHLSAPFPIEITPQAVKISPSQEILLRPFGNEGDDNRAARDRSQPRKIILAKVDRIHESPYGLYFTMRHDFRIALFISRDVMPPDEYAALCSMLKERFQSRYYKI